MRKILLVSYFAPPMQEIASERVIRFIRSFSNLGYELELLTMDSDDVMNCYISKNYENLLCNEFKHIKITKVSTRFKFFVRYFSDNSRGILNLFQRAIFKIVNEYITGDALGVTWSCALKKSLYQRIRCFKPDVVINTVGPHSTMFIVAKICNELGVPFVIDYRDLWSDNPHLELKFMAKITAKYKQSYALSRAKAVLSVSDCLVENIKSYKLNLNVFRVYNLLDNVTVRLMHESAQKINFKYNSEYLNLFYAGTIYRGENARSFEVILRAINKLDKNVQSKIRVHYFGSKDMVELEFKKFELEHLLLCYGRVDKNNVIAAMFAADVLISLINNVHLTDNIAHRGVMSGKIFEYIATGKPIINISSKDAEINNFFSNNKYNLFYSCSCNEINEMQKIILDLFTKKFDNNLCTQHSIPSICWEDEFDKVLPSLIN